ncbi:MAG: hypothetical protein H7317_11010 [Pseudorhodobacter sp.]|nr:hypothetical protein [Pseudorhodobacter sp.]
MNMISYGSGTKDDPWVLKTPSQTSDYTIWQDDAADQLVVMVGTTKLTYQLRCLADLHAMLKARGDWVLLGNADEGKPVTQGSVEAWARDDSNPVGGYYGLRKGYRGRFANYIPPLMEVLGLAELEHNPRNNRMRAI